MAYNWDSSADEAIVDIKTKKLSKSEIDSKEHIIAKSPQAIYMYSKYTGSRFPKGERSILENLGKYTNDTNCFYWINEYILKNIDGRWEEYEQEITKQKKIQAMILYSNEILKKPWVEFEKDIFKEFDPNCHYFDTYLKNFYHKKTNKILDEAILKKVEDQSFVKNIVNRENNVLTEYLVTKGEWKELEEKLLKFDETGSIIFLYSLYVKKARWEKGEIKLLSNIKPKELAIKHEHHIPSQIACVAVNFYARNLVKQPWEELEKKLELVPINEKTSTYFKDLVIDYARYSKKSYYKLLEKIKNIPGWSGHNIYKNYLISTKKTIEKLIKKKKFDEAISRYGEMPEFTKIITNLESKYLLSDSIRNYMIANKMANEKDENIIKYFDKDKLFKQKMKAFLEEFEDLTVKEVLSKI